MKTYSAKQLAQELHYVEPFTVIRAAKDLEMRKSGRVWFFTAIEARRIANFLGRQKIWDNRD